MASLQSHAQAGGGEGRGPMCILEVFQTDGESHAFVSKKSQPLPQSVVIPLTSPDGVSWETSLEKEERDQSGTLRRPHRVGIPDEKVRSGLVPIPTIDYRALALESPRTQFRFNVSFCCPI